MQVELFKKLSNYKDKDGKDVVATNFYVKCGSELIPISIKYFKMPDSEVDPNYRGHKMVLSSFADSLPDKKESKLPDLKVSKTVDNPVASDDEEIPF